MSKVDPPIMPLPQVWKEEQEIADFMNYFQEAVRQIWTRTGEGTDKVDSAALDTDVVHLSGAEDITATKTFKAAQNFEENIDITTGKVIRIGAKKVLGNRGAAVADATIVTATTTVGAAGVVEGAFDSEAKRDAVIATINSLVTDVTTLQSRLNASLSRQRDHGLIEP